MNEVFIAAGGTGGHIFPALSLAQYIVKEYPVRFIGTKRGMERVFIPEAGYPISFIRARGWDRKSGVDFLRAFGDNIVGLLQSLSLFLKYRPRAVLVFGSYVSLLIAFWAKLFHVPIYVQEQNIRPGFANRIISRWSEKTFVAVSDSIHYFKNQKKVMVTGNPLREDIIVWRGRKLEARKKLGLDPKRTTIFVLGGSRGSEIINAVFWKLLPFLSNSGFQVIHVTGSESFPEAKRRAATSSFPYLVYDFFPNPGIFYAAADFVVCRSGANVTFELFWFELPSILIPFAEATEGHQMVNAQWLQKQQPVIIVDEKNLSSQSLEEAIRSLIKLQPEKNKKNEDFQFAAQRIAGMIVEEIRRRK